MAFGVYRGGPAKDKVIKVDLVILEATVCGLGKTTAIKNYILPAVSGPVLNLDDCLVMWTPVGGDPEIDHNPAQINAFYVQPWSDDPFINHLSKEVALVSHFMGYTKATLNRCLGALFEQMTPGQSLVLTCTMSRHIPRSAVCFFYNHMTALAAGGPVDEAQVKVLTDCLERVFDFSVFAAVTVLDLESCGTLDAICETGHRRVHQRGRLAEVEFFKNPALTRAFYGPAHVRFLGLLLTPSDAIYVSQSPCRDELIIPKSDGGGQKWVVLRCVRPGVTGGELDDAIKELCLRWRQTGL
ncbi:protein ORF16 [Lake sturgeon herpesvirus]|nr:protein ORF16 [Lake sturgeon herpesvirus]